MLLGGDAPFEALAAQHSDLDLDHVEPAGVLGDIVELQPAQHSSRFGCAEGLVERTGRVRQQVFLATFGVDHAITDHVIVGVRYDHIQVEERNWIFASAVPPVIGQAGGNSDGVTACSSTSSEGNRGPVAKGQPSRRSGQLTAKRRASSLFRRQDYFFPCSSA